MLMRYKLLGHSGLRVSELALGTMTFGDGWGWGAPEAECAAILDAYADSGGNFIDTANKYTDGDSERIIGSLLQGRRDRFVVATKYSLTTDADDPNAGGNHRKSLVRSVEASLQRLEMDYIDLLWLHAWDFMTPVDEVMRALDDLVRAGKVLYVGVSDTPAWVIARCNTMAELRGWSRFIGVQLQYSLTERSAERELLHMARSLDIGVTAWGVLASGVLSGKYNDVESVDQVVDSKRASLNEWRLTERNLAIARRLSELSDTLGCTPSQLAVAWARRGGAIIPILGARTAAQVCELIASLQVQLEDKHLASLDEVSAIKLGFPHDFLTWRPIEKSLFGKSLPLIDDHREGRPSQRSSGSGSREEAAK
jgi:aryl-alcohol dehydrogenase-like predicted oxidoreductase